MLWTILGAIAGALIFSLGGVILFGLAMGAEEFLHKKKLLFLYNAPTILSGILIVHAAFYAVKLIDKWPPHWGVVLFLSLNIIAGAFKTPSLWFTASSLLSLGWFIFRFYA